MSQQSNDNKIFYFLGNIPSHIAHALPIYNKLGGTFVVLSKKAEAALAAYDVPVLCMDDRPDLFLYLDSTVSRTLDYVNNNANIVLFYELFSYPRIHKIKKPTTLFLTHGNMLKSYMTTNPKRLRIFKDYDYMAALSPHLYREFNEENGINASKLLKLGIARTDDVVRNKGKITGRAEIAHKLGLNPLLPMFSYMPTYWGGSSVHHIGKEIISRIPECYTLVFRPHPQTPTYIIESYEAIIKHKPNVSYAPDSLDKDINMLSLFEASDAIIGDVSSVMLEAILSDKPLIFAGITGREELEEKDLSSIKEVVGYSTRININNYRQLEVLLASSLVRKIDPQIWDMTKDRVFYHHDGTSVEAISDFVKSKL